MYKEKFVLSVIHDGRPIKESGSGSNRQVAVPFGSEYKIRLKNKNDRSCTARITIDGTPVSNFGDVIVGAGATVDLERFITSSMNSGKRFKFVTLDHSDVDDPTKSENGVIRVEFRLAKQKNGIKITPTLPWNPPMPPWYENNDGMHWNTDATYKFNSSEVRIGDNYSKSSSKVRSDADNGITSVMYCASNCGGTSSLNATEAGATVEGGHSNQSFGYANLDVESHATVLELRIVGIKQGHNTSSKQYCTSCGHRIKKSDRYCGGCGRRL